MKVLARLLVVGLVVMAGVAAAEDDKFMRPSLKALKGVEVVVEPLKAAIEQNGLTQTSIQTDVELKLRQVGIPVLSQSERINAPGAPYLYIDLTMLDIEVQKAHGYAYALKVELNQTVRLDRDPSIVCLGSPTWSMHSVGTVDRSNIRQVRDSIKDHVDRFINAYLSVNPK